MNCLQNRKIKGIPESARIESINLKAKADLINKISVLEKSLISNYTILDYTDMMALTDELLGYKESSLI